MMVMNSDACLVSAHEYINELEAAKRGLDAENAELRAQRDALAERVAIVEAALGARFRSDEPLWGLVLNKYQRDNLLWLLNLCGYPAGMEPVGDFALANTGDWLGEIAFMLAPGGTCSELRPNVSRDEVIQSVEGRRKALEAGR